MDVRVPWIEQMEALRSLIAAPRLAIEPALAILNLLATQAVGVGQAVQNARDAVAAVPGGDARHEAIARYMVARVVVMLEQDALKASAERDPAGDQPRSSPK